MQTAGPHRDLVGELTAAVKQTGVTMGLYHSMFEWFNPNFLQVSCVALWLSPLLMHNLRIKPTTSTHLCS